MENSPFARLPPELRNNIYELALTHFEPIKFEPILETDGLMKAKAVAPFESKLIALTKTCKQIHAESRGLVYSCNTFMFINYAVSDDYTQCLTALTAHISEASAAAIRTVHINVGRVLPHTSDLARMLTAARDIQSAQKKLPRCAFELRFSMADVPGGDGGRIELGLDCRSRERMQASRMECVEESKAWASRTSATIQSVGGRCRQSRLAYVKNMDKDFAAMVDKVCVSFEKAGW